ncbi:MAG: aminopeptidase N [Proteobacteria bacterium]|nr:aminopeptidase N [Pseudomonadota bacterium]
MRLLAAALLLAPGLAWGRPAIKGLSKEEARLRAAHVKDVDYALFFKIDGERPDFTGRVEASFSIDAPYDGLTLDFEAGSVGRLEVNGVPVSSPAYNGMFLTLPAAALKTGHNVATVEFTHPYSTTGAGVYRFVDPEDKRVYLWSQFEPFDASKAFPCFDQPDLKATYAVKVEAPKDWKVVSTARETTTIEAAGRRTWVFGQTARLSTYLLSLHAGPYRVWTSAAGKVPLRLFARESMAQYVDAEEWFKITRQGLDFYAAYFGIPYPFGKYDQLIVPDFNAGAMENAGAVTFSERNVHRSAPTAEDKEKTASDILHEMAHMWFGDYVTMRWWNGLWLNESFATYMAVLAMAEATEYKHAWRSFFADDKVRAYGADQLSTTHPVEGDVPDTAHAWANFDAITYGKGAAVMRQLEFFLGADVFREGVRAYMKAHAYSNTEERDFFAAMERVSGKDLAPWIKEWVNEAGLNSVRADFACDGGKVSRVSLLQTAPAAHPALRSHRTEVALYRAAADGTLQAVATARADYAGAKTEIPELSGKDCPDFVLPNAGDRDYVRLELDARSLEAVGRGVSVMKDAHHRMMLWHALWEMVQDARFSASTYAGLAAKDLGGESDLQLLGAVLQTVSGKRNTSPSIVNFLSKPDERLESAFWSNLRAAAPGSDLQKTWLDQYIDVASGKDAEKNLRSLLAGTAGVSGLDEDQDRRWGIVVALNSLGVKDGEAMIASEAKRDASDRGLNAAITARASRPALKSKRQWLERIVDVKSKMTSEELRSAMYQFYPPTQRDAGKALFKRFLETLPALSDGKDDDFLESYGLYMTPFLCDETAAAALEARLDAHPTLNPNLAKPLRDSVQEWRRCVKIRALLRG